MALTWADFGAIRELRGFARAMVVAGRRQLTDPMARRLAEQLARQAAIGIVKDSAEGDRTAIFSRFLHLHRRHVWQNCADDSEYEWPEPGKSAVDHKFIRAVQRLPLELREVLLLATLTELTHRQAATAAGLPVEQFVELLDRARKRLSALLGETEGARAPATWERAAHLRVVK